MLSAAEFGKFIGVSREAIRRNTQKKDALAPEFAYERLIKPLP
jgi:hypothetical protein